MSHEGCNNTPLQSQIFYFGRYLNQLPLTGGCESDGMDVAMGSETEKEC